MIHILLVEDNVDNRDMLSRRLERKGYSVSLAIDGQDGIDKAKELKPQLILMDMSLPIIDGWEATKILKQDPAMQHIPIIALTAHAMSGDREKAMEAGCNEYDTKPIEIQGLLEKIEVLTSSIK